MAGVSEMSSASQQLPFSIDSFTYSWCINLNPPSLDSLSSSLRFSLDHTLSDYFDIDLLELLESPNSDPDRPSPATESASVAEPCRPPTRPNSSVMRRLKRCLANLILRMVLRRRGSGKRVCSSRVDAIDDQSFSYGNNGRSSSCDSETSIHEAVLHCKRSIGK